VVEQLEKEKVKIDILINNAGIGDGTGTKDFFDKAPDF